MHKLSKVASLCISPWHVGADTLTAVLLLLFTNAAFQKHGVMCTCLCEGEEQGHVGVDALLLQDLARPDALPRGRDLQPAAASGPCRCELIPVERFAAAP